MREEATPHVETYLRAMLAFHKEEDNQADILIQGLAETTQPQQYDTPPYLSTATPPQAAWGALDTAPLAPRAHDDDDDVYAYNDPLPSYSTVSNAPPERLYSDAEARSYPGISNQGATCYLNSLLQVLVNIPYFRVSLYRMNVESEKGASNIPMALQKLLYEMEVARDRAHDTYGRSTVSSVGLTDSFGWTAADVMRQHDAQELLRVLTDSLSEHIEKVEKNPHSNFIKKLFRFELVRYTRCLDMEYESTHTEECYDVSLTVKDKANLAESLHDYFKEEVLDGDNKFRVEFKDGRKELHTVARGARLRSLPPVLILHLNRFEFDPYTGNQKKVNDRFAFPLELDLSQYVEGSGLPRDASDASKGDLPRECTAESFAQPPGGEDFQYCLHAVTVHSGTIHGGHYWCYAKPEGPSEPWVKFNDSTVSAARCEEAVQDSFGSPPSAWGGSSPTAYLLTYVRKSSTEKLYTMPTPEDLDPVRRRFQRALQREAAKKKERDEAYRFFDIVPLCAKDMVEGLDLKKTPQGLCSAVTAANLRFMRAKENIAEAEEADLPAPTEPPMAVRVSKGATMGELRSRVLAMLLQTDPESGLVEYLNDPNATVRKTIRLWKIDKDSSKIDGGCRTPLVTFDAVSTIDEEGVSSVKSQREYCGEHGASRVFERMEDANSSTLESCFGYVSQSETVVQTQFVFVEVVEVREDVTPPSAPSRQVSLLSNDEVLQGEGGLVFVKEYDPFALEDDEKLSVCGVVSCNFATTSASDVLSAVALSANEGLSEPQTAVFIEESEKKITGIVHAPADATEGKQNLAEVVPELPRAPQSSYYSWDNTSATGYDGWLGKATRRETIIIVQQYHSEEQLRYLMFPELDKYKEPVAHTERATLGAMCSPPATPADLHLFKHNGPDSVIFSCRDYFLETLHRMTVLLEPLPYNNKNPLSLPVLDSVDAFSAALWKRGVTQVQEMNGMTEETIPLALPEKLRWTPIELALRKCETLQQASERVARRLRKHYSMVFQNAIQSAGADPLDYHDYVSAVQQILKTRVTGATTRLTVHKRMDNKPDSTHLKYYHHDRELDTLIREADMYPGDKDGFTHYRLYFEHLPLPLSEMDQISGETYINVLGSLPLTASVLRSESQSTEAFFQEGSQYSTLLEGELLPAEPGITSQHYFHLSREVKAEELGEDYARPEYGREDPFTVAELCRWLLCRLQSVNEASEVMNLEAASRLTSDRVLPSTTPISDSLDDYALIILDAKHEIVFSSSASSLDAVHEYWCTKQTSTYSYSPNYAWYLLKKPASLNGSTPPKMLSEAQSEEDAEESCEICLPIVKVTVARKNDLYSRNDTVACFGLPLLANVFRSDSVGFARGRIVTQLLGGTVNLDEEDTDENVFTQRDLPLYAAVGYSKNALHSEEASIYQELLRSYCRTPTYLCCELPMPKVEVAPTTGDTVILAPPPTSYSLSRPAPSLGVSFR